MSAMFDAWAGGYGGQFMSGFLLTLAVSLCSYALGIIFGVIGMATKLSSWRWARVLGGLYTTIVRAIPELLLLLISFYILASQLASVAHWIGLEPSNFEFNPFLVAVVSLGFIQGAYITEILRGSVLAVPRGQLDAARALGLSRKVQWVDIMMPQALRHALPSLGNVWLNATKDSSLISVVGSFADILKVSSLAAVETQRFIFFYSLAAACFLIITLVSMILLKWLHARVSRGVIRV